MRVLQVIPAVAPRYGGPSSSILEMVEALSQAGVSTMIATTNADGQGELEVPLGVQTTWRGSNAIFFRRQWSEAFKFSAPLGRWLAGHVHEFDVVHIHAALSFASLAAARAARRKGVPYVVRPLGTLDAWSLAQKALKKRVLMPWVVRMLRRANAVHYTSSEEQRQVEAAFHLSNGVVVPLGVHSRALEEPPAGDEARSADRYVLALSRLHPVKNIEALIDAFAALTAEQRRGWRLIVGGGGDETYAAALDSRIRLRQATAFIERRGWTSGEDKHRLVRGASLFALPSHHENFGVGLVEAMAAGVPALVSRGVHLSDAIDTAGAGWVTDVSSGSIRDALAEAIADDRTRLARAAAARALSARFAWPVVAADLATLYARLSLGGRDRVAAGAPVSADRQTVRH